MTTETHQVWFTSKVKMIGAVIGVLMTAGAAITAADTYMSKYALQADVNQVQIQLEANYLEGQVDIFQEKVYEIKDKIIDKTATIADEKKLLRLENKVRNITHKIQNIRAIK